MQVHDWLGWLAAALTLATFSMRAMMPLRACAIGSNCAFIAYGVAAAAYPVLILHAVLLPFNVARLVEMRRLVRQIRRAAGGEVSAEWLRPYSHAARLAPAEVLFRKGEPASRTYFLVEGTLDLPDIGERLEPGRLVGEIGAFSPGHVRTQTVRAASACTLLVIDNQALRQLYFQNPTFGLHLLDLVTRRLSADAARLESKLADLGKEDAPAGCRRDSGG